MELLKVKYNDSEMPIENVKVVLHRKLNDHDSAHITGMMKEEQYDKYVEVATSETKIELEFTRNGEKKLVFVGVLDSISADTEGVEENAVYFVSIDALAYTSKMDLKLHKESFQDKNMMFDELIDEVIKKYPAADKKMEVGKGIPIQYFTLQYRETDWEFMVRQASLFNEPLVCESTSNAPRFRFGLKDFTDRGKIERYNYRIIKKINNFRISSENKYILGASEFDFINYQIFLEEEDKPLSIGDRIQYKGMTMYICKSTIEIRDHNIYNTINICTQQGLRQNRLYNEKIVGVSIIGKVLDAKANMLKLHLEIDEFQDITKAWWFDYATFYSTWYCMPEINDYVNLHFSKNEEVKAIALNSLKQKPEGSYDRNNSVPVHGAYNGQMGISGQGTFGANTEGGSQSPIYSGGGGSGSAPKTGGGVAQPIEFEPMATDPNVKMLTTQDNKTIALGPDHITIDTGAGTYIKLTDGGGIEIYTDSDIDMYAGNNIKVDCVKEMYVEAKELIKMTCAGSTLQLEPFVITATSKDVDMN